MRPVLTFLLLLASAGCASAEDPESATKSATVPVGTTPAATSPPVAVAAGPELEQLRDQIEQALPGIDRDNVHPSVAPGLYEINRGAIFGYVTSDGQYLIQGDMINVATGEEITEKRRMAMRKSLVDAVGGDQSITFGPEKPRHVVTVFTDIDCGYCRKMHNEMAAYNSQGISVRYLFFPRSGPNTPSFEKAQKVWCSADRNEAMTQAKRGVAINAETSCPNPVLEHYQTGEAIGVNATPMMVLPNGELVRGYVPARNLALRLEQPTVN